MSSPETSIIIRTFNEERYLPGLLEGIAKQRCRDFEIVNVDSGSYDRTVDIARQHGARVLGISSRDFTFGYSLNVGIEAALGRFMVIVSAHTAPVDEDWLEKLVEPLRQEGVAMVYGRQYGVDSSKYGEVTDLERTFGPRRKVLRPPHYFANNANSAILRELWEQHPFDDALPGQEDIEWARHWMERGYSVVYEPEAGIYHIHHETWRQVRRRYYREALATRHIGVWRRSDALPLALKEAGYLATDALDALRRGQLASKGSEILKFRYHKAHGTVSGLLDGKVMATPSGRDSLFFDRKCKAVVITGREQADLQEVDVPSLKPGDVLVEVSYAGVTSADLGMFTGDSSFFGGETPRYPVIPGRELSGRVARVGANVAHLREGDPVVVQPPGRCGLCDGCLSSPLAPCAETGDSPAAQGMGAYAEYLAVPGRYAHKLPAGLDMKKAVSCGALAVVLKALRKLDLLLKGTPGIPRFAVVGAGPVGHLCAQVLSMRECPVTVFDRNPRRLDCFQGTAVSTGQDLKDLGDFNVLVEATGSVERLQAMLDGSGPGSSLLLLGLPYSNRQFTVHSAAALDKTMIWSSGASAKDFQEAASLLPRLPTEALTGSVFPMHRFREAWDAFRGGEPLKVLLQVS